MFVSIKKILPRALKRIGAEEVLKAINIKGVWQNLISDNYGEEALTKIRITSFKNKILTVQCPNSIWAAELKLRSDFLISEINKKMQYKAVVEIKFIY